MKNDFLRRRESGTYHFFRCQKDIWICIIHFHILIDPYSIPKSKNQHCMIDILKTRSPHPHGNPMEDPENKSTYAEFLPEAHGLSCPGAFLRMAKPSDARSIALTEVASNGPYPKPFEDIVTLITKDLTRISLNQVRRKVWVALVGDQVVGFAICSHRDKNDMFPDLPQGWYLSGVTVAPNWRRKGIGRRLVLARIHWRQSQTSTIYYNTEIHNQASEAMHREFGFVQIQSHVLSPAPQGRKTRQRLFRLVF